MSDDTDRTSGERPRPPAQASPPSEPRDAGGTPMRNTDPSAERAEPAGDGGDEPRSIDLGARSFANTNMAADQRRQRDERGAGLGAGGSDNRDARHGLPEDRRGDVPEDDLD